MIRVRFSIRSGLIAFGVFAALLATFAEWERRSRNPNERVEREAASLLIAAGVSVNWDTCPSGPFTMLGLRDQSVYVYSIHARDVEAEQVNEILQNCSMLDKLRSVDISGNEDNGPLKLPGFSLSQSVESIQLINIAVDAELVQSIARLSRLRKLHVHTDEVRASALELSSLPKSLVALEAGRTGAPKWVEFVKTHGSIRFLSLAHTRDVASSIVPSLQASSIATLQLHKGQLTQQDCDQLRSSGIDVTYSKSPLLPPAWPTNFQR